MARIDFSETPSMTLDKLIEGLMEVRGRRQAGEVSVFFEVGGENFRITHVTESDEDDGDFIMLSGPDN